MKTTSTEEDRIAIQTEETPGNGNSRVPASGKIAPLKTLNVRLTGVRPLLLHNGQTADPLNKHAKELKKLTKVKNKSDDQYIELKEQEWMASIYWNETLGLYIPSDNIERCIQLGAQKIKMGKIAQAALFLSQESVKIEYEGMPKDKDEIYADERFRLEKPVRIQNARTVRVRAMIPTGWKLTFDIEYEPDLIVATDIAKALDHAGAVIGLGDWRPKFGRFLSEVIS